MLICGHQCKGPCAEQCTTEKCKELTLISTKKIDSLACGHDKVWVICCDRDKGKISLILIY